MLKDIACNYGGRIKLILECYYYYLAYIFNVGVLTNQHILAHWQLNRIHCWLKHIGNELTLRKVLYFKIT
jgi:hypothetical protein